LRGEVERVLISEAQLARRVRRMARDIEHDFQGRELVIVSLLTGTVLFLADLVRHVNLPLRLDFIGVSSYGAGTESGDLVFTKELRLDVRGRRIRLLPLSRVCLDAHAQCVQANESAAVGLVVSALVVLEGRDGRVEQ